jgi:hypothetical protein
MGRYLSELLWVDEKWLHGARVPYMQESFQKVSDFGIGVCCQVSFFGLLSLTLCSDVAITKLKIAAAETRKLITTYCEMERRRPFTQDIDHFKRRKQEILDGFFEGRDQGISHQPPSKPIAPSNSNHFLFGDPPAPVCGTLGQAPQKSPQQMFSKLQTNGVGPSESSTSTSIKYCACATKCK